MLVFKAVGKGTIFLYAESWNAIFGNMPLSNRKRSLRSAKVQVDIRV